MRVAVTGATGRLGSALVAALEDAPFTGPAADVYGLGATLYYLLTGRAPFVGATPAEIVARVERDPPDRPRALRPAVSDRADGYVISSATVEDERFPGARTFVFAARDPDLAELAEGFAGDDAILGGLLGYPACCIRAYAANREHYHARLEPPFAGRGEPMPYWTNTPLDVFGWHLISHFPCSPGCAPTRRSGDAGGWIALARRPGDRATHDVAEPQLTERV